MAVDLTGGSRAEDDCGGIGTIGGSAAGGARPAAIVAGDGRVGGGGAVVVRGDQLGGLGIEERVDLSRIQHAGGAPAVEAIHPVLKIDGNLMEIVEPPFGRPARHGEEIGGVGAVVGVPRVGIVVAVVGIGILGEIVVPQGGHPQFAAAVFFEIGADADPVHVLGEGREQVVIDERIPADVVKHMQAGGGVAEVRRCQGGVRLQHVIADIGVLRGS